MNVDIYVAIIDTLIFALLVGWSYMDRSNIYFRNK